MPVVKSGKVLVTGASGYLGAWVVKDLIDLGYTVVVAVRNTAQGDFIINRFPEYKGKVTSTIVTDIEAEGAYDEAVKDVDGIIHTASPVVWKWEDPSEITGPAINGAVGILKSAKKNGSKVKRVVLTSSVVAIVGDSPSGADGHLWDEKIWNEESNKVLAEKGKETSPWDVYNASKTQAEQAARAFIASEKPAFDLTTILPVWCWGPFIHDVSQRGVGSTPAVFLGTFGEDGKGETSGKPIGDAVDVRDSAHLHVASLGSEAATGERITTTSSTYAWQDLYDVLLDSNIAPGKVPGKATYGTSKVTPTTSRHSGADSLRIFGPDGFKYRPFSDSIREMGEDFVKNKLL